MSPPTASSRTLFGLPKLPARYAVLVMPLFLSILMTFIVSMVSTLRSIGLAPGFMIIWLGAWGSSWLVAFPTLLVVSPFVRRLATPPLAAGLRVCRRFNVASHGRAFVRFRTFVRVRFDFV